MESFFPFDENPRPRRGPYRRPTREHSTSLIFYGHRHPSLPVSH